MTLLEYIIDIKIKLKKLGLLDEIKHNETVTDTSQKLSLTKY